MEQNTDDGQMTGRFYTSARRFKQVLGSLPDGTKIPGGPYTYTQIGVMLATFVLGWLTRGIWGTDSAIGDLIILIAVAFGLGFIISRMPQSRRNPLKLLASTIALFTHPGAGGRWRGRPMKLNTKAQRTQREAQKRAKAEGRAQKKPAEPVKNVPVEAPPAPVAFGSSLNRLAADYGLLPDTERKN